MPTSDKANILPENPERRTFLKTVAAAAATNSIITKASAGFGDNINAYSALKNLTFMNQNGTEIKGDALRSAIGNNPFTISFGFNGCSNYCPTGNSVFAYLGKATGDKIKHIMINVNPELDGSNQAMRNVYSDFVEHNPGPPGKQQKNGTNMKNVIILYPTKDGKLSNEQAVKTSTALGNMTAAGDYSKHSGMIRIYDAGGQHKGWELSDPNASAEKLADNLIKKLSGQIAR